jgi:nucleotide-binding universal stress UspA family protein
MTWVWFVLAAAAVAFLFGVWVARRRLRTRRVGPRRILVPFTGGDLDPTVLAAAIRIARAEQATLVPAYLIVTPLEYSMDAPMGQQVAMAVPLLEAVENEASRAGIPVDARIEAGRTPTHALQRLWEAEHFDRIVAPAPANRGPGFSPKDLEWILAHAPSETVILKPDPDPSAPGHPVAA